jgi:hypothetical protein
MLASSAQRILAGLGEDAVVLDVGGWNRPFGRADWVIDLMPHSTRGESHGWDSEDRFTEGTWVERDICAREPWPFADQQFDFAVCSQTLEDIRDPVWVCEELSRVAKAGYIEVPSRLEEQTWGINGEWVGWSHHHWLVDLAENEAHFTLKPHFLHARPDLQLPLETLQGFAPEGRTATLFWRQELRAEDRIHYSAQELESYLRAALDEAGLKARSPRNGRGLFARVRTALGGS